MRKKKKQTLIAIVFLYCILQPSWICWLQNFTREGFCEQIAEIHIYINMQNSGCVLILANKNMVMVPLL